MPAPSRRRTTGPSLMQRSRTVSPALKASYHEYAGAGRKQVLRPFFGLTDEDAKEIEGKVNEALDRALKA